MNLRQIIGKGPNFRSQFYPINFFDWWCNSYEYNKIANSITLRDLHFRMYPLYVHFFHLFLISKHIADVTSSFVLQKPNKYFATYIATRDREGQMVRGNIEMFTCRCISNNYHKKHLLLRQLSLTVYNIIRHFELDRIKLHSTKQSIKYLFNF